MPWIVLRVQFLETRRVVPSSVRYDARASLRHDVGRTVRVAVNPSGHGQIGEKSIEVGGVVKHLVLISSRKRSHVRDGRSMMCHDDQLFAVLLRCLNRLNRRIESSGRFRVHTNNVFRR